MDIVQTTPVDLLGPLNEVEQKFAPAKLYACGDRSLFQFPRVSIVGTRKPSSEGIALAKSLVQTLVSHNVVVVSGLAEGIDTVAHTEVIAKRGRTIAVLGTGLRQYFPKENEALQNQIMRDHLAISQFEPEMRGSKSSFPQRNRTMALLSYATIIVEAGEKSGTEHQGWEAIRLGRALFVSELLAEKNFDWVEKLRFYGAEVLKSTFEEDIFDVVPMMPHDTIDQASV